MNRFKLFCVVSAVMFIMTACFGGSSRTDTYTASGVITDSDDNPVEEVTLLFDGYGTTQTNTQGEWVKSGLRGSVKATPVKEGYVFDPPSQNVTPTFAKQVNFVGLATTLSILPTEVTLQVDDTQEFSASGRDKYGQPVVVSPNWLVTGGIGVASPANGPKTTFTATTPGEGTVVAEDGDLVVYAIVTVVPRQESYDINVTHAIDPTPVDDAGGVITATIDKESYVYGDTVTLTANPSPGWRFLRWEGDVESSEPTIEMAVIDPDFEPTNPFGAGVLAGGRGVVIWEWPPLPDITYHPEVVAYGDSLTNLDGTREQAGDLLMEKFASRSLRAVFEKEY